MKRILFNIVITLLCLHNFVVLGQGTWVLQNNPTTQSGESMQFVSAAEGWIGLSSKQLLHTTNAGLTWNIVDPNPAILCRGSDAPGRRVSFINANTGWVLKTLVNTSDDDTGVVLYKTVNGGLTWTTTILSNILYDSGIQVQFVDENNGWILIFNMETGVPTFLKTINGGLTWTPTNGRGIFYFLSPTVGYAFSADPQGNPPFIIYKTTDGGTTWTTQYTDTTPGSFEDMFFLDVNNGWIVGDAGKILKTTNGGLYWTPVTNAGLNSDFKSGNVQFLNTNVGWISTRLNGTNFVYMLKTTDGGANWVSQLLPFDMKVYSMHFWDENNGWAAADGGPIAKYNGSMGNYTNATLNGPWLYYTNLSPIDPNNDNLGYIIFNGSGGITGFNGFVGGPPQANYGNYTVNPNGQFSGTILVGEETFPFSGVLTSNTFGALAGDGFGFNLSKIANPGELQDVIAGTISAAECGSREVSLGINSSGQIINQTGFSQATGHVFADQGVFIGHFYTGEGGAWNELSISGYYSNNTLTGFTGLDWSTCTNGNVVLTRSFLSADDFNQNGALIVYPNPNNGNFSIKFGEPKASIQVEIYDILGKKVYSNDYLNVDELVEIGFNPQKNGVYFIKVFDGNNSFNSKIIIN